MECTLWTDERIDDMVDRIEKRFDRVDTELREVRGEIADLRRQMRQYFLVHTTAILGLAAAMVVHSL